MSSMRKLFLAALLILVPTAALAVDCPPLGAEPSTAQAIKDQTALALCKQAQLDSLVKTQQQKFDFQSDLQAQQQNFDLELRLQQNFTAATPQVTFPVIP
jgi:hypothetical protein